MFGIKKKSPTLPTTPLAASQPITYHVFLAEALKQLLAAKELQGVKPRLPKLKEAVEHAVNGRLWMFLLGLRQRLW